MSTDLLNTPTDFFHNLIKRVKESGEISDVRFIKAMGIQPAERPVTGYIAVCEIVKSQYETAAFESGKDNEFGVIHKLKCGLCLMGKKHSSAYDLQKKMDLIIEAITRFDTEGFVVETETRYARYNKDAEALTQQLYIFMEIYGRYSKKEVRV